MHRLRKLCLGLLVTCLCLGSADAQEDRTYRQVEIRASDGALRGRHTAREQKPADLLSTPIVHMTFMRRRDVVDQLGRIVSGVGLSAWMEGDGARVWLFSLVPKDGVENGFYGSREGIASTARNTLDEFVLQVGEKRTVSEMKAWGVEPLVLQLIEVTR